MEKLLVTSLLLALIGVSSCHGTSIFDQLRVPRIDCINGALSCSDDCNQVQLCVSGQLENVEDCPEDAPCNSVTTTCVTGSFCSSPSPTFTCHGLGYFPDPYDCTVYHICSEVGGVSQKIPCRAQTAFDPSANACTRKLTDRICVEKPIPTCTANLQRGAQVENPNIYYICVKVGNTLVPNLYKCDQGEVYQTDRCVAQAIQARSSVFKH